MRRVMVIVASLVLVGMMVGSVYANCGTCGTSKSESSSSGQVYTSEQLSSLSLTSTQKKRIEAAQKMYNSRVESILTKEQKAKLCGSSEKTESKSSGCGAPKKSKGGCR